jgi:hypothetical protein
MIDYYAIFQVPPYADYLQIKSAYRRLALQHHPDVTGNTTDTSRMQLINEAYSVLKNPAKRASYDFLRKYGEPPRQPWTTQTPATAQSIYYSSGQDGRNWAERVQNFFYRVVKGFLAALLQIFVIFLFPLIISVYGILLSDLVRLLGYQWNNTQNDKYVFLIIIAVSVFLMLLTIRSFRKILRFLIQHSHFSRQNEMLLVNKE